MDRTSTSRFELGSVSPGPGFTENYQNGPRGHLAPNLGRSSSFKESAENRSFSSVKTNPRRIVSLSGEVPSLSQMLNPIFTGDLKNGRTSEMKRVMSFSFSSDVEDNSFGVSHSKNSPPVPTEESRGLKASVSESCVKATVRSKKLDEHLSMLNRFFEGFHSKKQRSGLLTRERSSGSTLKTGSLVQRNPSESGISKHDDRPKKGDLNKRLRTSADSKSDCRNIGVIRQPLMVAKENDMLNDINEVSEMEEKIRKLPSSGEGWYKKMKRKRSMGAVISRSVDDEATIKRNMPPEQTIYSSLQSGESTPNFRSSASGGSNKSDTVFSTVASAAHPTLKMDKERSLLTRDTPAGPIKERELGIRLNNRDEYHGIFPGPIVKGKASRTPRSGSMAAANSPANIIRVVGTLESWEQPQGTDKMSSIGGISNQKRPVSAGSTAHPVTQWVGQRPQKLSWTKRTNLVPVSNDDEMQMQGSFLGSEEPVAAENRNEKSSSIRDGEERLVCDSGFGLSVPLKKKKTMIKEGSGDVVKRQGRTARASPFSRGNGSPTTYSMDNAGSNKPPRNVKFTSAKNGSKSGRSLKKITDGKSFSRNGQVANECSSDRSGVTYDDHEELLTAANLACSSDVNACPSAFWKTVEPLFACIGPEEKPFISQQMKMAEETYRGLSQSHRNEKTTSEHLDDYGHEEITACGVLFSNKKRCTKVDNELKLSLDGAEYVKPLQNPSLYGFSDTEVRLDVVSPLYQRVLSALILEEEIEELEETGFGRSRVSINESCVSIDSGSKQVHDIHIQKDSSPHVIRPCNGYKKIDRSAAAQHCLCNGDLLHINGVSCCSRGDQMCLEEKLMLELQSLGLYLEAVPALEDKEDELSEEMAQLERELHGLLESKRTCLDKIQKVIQEGSDSERNLEQVAMDNLVESAYKKLLATKASYASEHGIPKVSKQVALSFAKRTLVRCQKYEETRVSCFSEPTLREIVYASPPQFSETELLSSTSLAVDGSKTSDDVARNGPPYNRSKKKEAFLDDVSGGFRALVSSGEVKGKRSERGRDALGRNSIPKSGRDSDRKLKSKPKQKTAQLGTNVSNPPSSELASNNATNRMDVRLPSSRNNGASAATESVDFDFGIDDLGLGGTGDLNSLLNFEGLQDHDSIGLEIPMDDIAELNMFC